MIQRWDFRWQVAGCRLQIFRFAIEIAIETEIDIDIEFLLYEFYIQIRNRFSKKKQSRKCFRNGKIHAQSFYFFWNKN